MRRQEKRTAAAVARISHMWWAQLVFDRICKHVHHSLVAGVATAAPPEAEPDLDPDNEYTPKNTVSQLQFTSSVTRHRCGYVDRERGSS